MTDSEVETRTEESSPAELAIERDSPEGDMLMAVQSGSVVFLARSSRSSWTSPFHAAGFRHIGTVPGSPWTDAEEAALGHIREVGWVRVRDAQHWVLTERGRRQHWVWHPIPGS
jgi:hypothetical protein